MVREIITFPDQRLREVSKPVTKVTLELQTLADDMIETMYAANGIGLAAIQVAEPVRLLVIDTRPRDLQGRYEKNEMTELEKAVQQPIVIFNPEIVNKEEKTTFDEGCLSVPGFYETVTRAKYVEVKGLNRDGKEFVIKTDGLLGICLQHEMDHLEGKLFIDRISLIKSNKIKNQIKKHGYPARKTDEEETEETAQEEAEAVKL